MESVGPRGFLMNDVNAMKGQERSLRFHSLAQSLIPRSNICDVLMLTSGTKISDDVRGIVVFLRRRHLVIWPWHCIRAATMAL